MKKSTMKTVIDILARELEMTRNNLAWQDEHLEKLNDELSDMTCRLEDQVRLEDEIDKLKCQLAESHNELRAARTSKTITPIELERFLREDDAPISRIKAIRAITGCGLKEAKDFYENFMRGHSFQEIPRWEPGDIYSAE